MKQRDSEAIVRPRKKKPLLADLLSQLCHDLDPDSGKWSTETRAKFNTLYCELSDIDMERS
jgi:hypothetical protein